MFQREVHNDKIVYKLRGIWDKNHIDMIAKKLALLDNKYLLNYSNFQYIPPRPPQPQHFYGYPQPMNGMNYMNGSFSPNGYMQPTYQDPYPHLGTLTFESEPIHFTLEQYLMQKPDHRLNYNEQVEFIS